MGDAGVDVLACQWHRVYWQLHHYPDGRIRPLTGFVAQCGSQVRGLLGRSGRRNCDNCEALMGVASGLQLCR